ncbi:MAG TPA: hypothetical protein VNR87_02315 [Flavisolibacter sp.]|nr:hypothetical protein [Flavisolibacter sp.]
MALQINIQYRDQPVTYDVTIQDEEIYHLRLNGRGNKKNGDYVPEKVIIRRKGKIWISDLENYGELVDSLTKEIWSFNSNHNSLV